ncbi:DsrE family protein [Endozoicomonas lisbonensis]|uniref:Peroxiredoxin n=1 Tax=Endozoicomonas lisbonensis TaxID=3120522 RepID=A0ABV2SGP0_9GAMM
MKVLSIVETAYRATIEEQDDTIIWLSHAIKGAGADMDVLLQGNAVNYGVLEQDAGGLAIGKEPQTQPPDIVGDIEALIEKGCKVFVVREDLDARGIKESELLEGLNKVARSNLADCLNGYDQVWHW